MIRSAAAPSSPLLGILFSAIAFLLFTLFDTVTKVLARDYSVFQIMAVEFATATALLIAFALVKDRTASGPATLVIKRPSLHGLRGLMQIGAQSLVYLAIPHLSLAEFYVIVFCMPIIVVLKGGFFLKERPAAFIWPILGLNFVGVLIALRPDQGINLWAFVVLAGTVVFAGSVVILRKMMESETPEAAAITASLALALASLVAAIFVYKPVEWPDGVLMILGGVLFAPGQVLFCTALRLAPTSLVGPPQFLQLVYGALAGYIVFGDVPTRWIYAGGAIVISANLFLIFATAQRKSDNIPQRLSRYSRRKQHPRPL